MKKIILKKGKELKLQNYYQWIFKDDIAGADENIKPGEAVEILAANGLYVGKGFYNPDAHIPVRVITIKDLEIDEAIRRHLLLAIQKRANSPYARYVSGEADFIPGLIVDRFNHYLVIQTRNPGIHSRLELITDFLVSQFRPEGIILRNDFETLREKHIPRENKVLYGKIPDNPVIIHDGEVQIKVDILKGQKTGFFFDQTYNRKRVYERISSGEKGLDLYCYTGSFALHAAKAGASVTAVDISEEDLQLGYENAELNEVSDRITFVKSDVMQFIRSCEEEMDFIICDPPALAKKRSELGRIQYMLVDLLIEILRVLKPGGWAVVFSCSYLLDWEFMVNTIRIAASKARVPVFLEEVTLQNKDHPVLLQMPETLYLKGFWIRKGENL